MRYDERPIDHTPVATAELSPTPIRDRSIPATAWLQAPAELLALGADLPDAPTANYIRRIGNWLVWRAGPARGAAARYWAGAIDDLSRSFTLVLDPDGKVSGIGPSGTSHTRFRSWKEDLRDHP